LVYENMTPDEAMVLREIMQTIKTERDEYLEPKQVREIVPIEEWISNRYYVGYDGMKLYDFWKEHIIDIFKKDGEGNDGNNYDEVIITGALSTGKSTASIFMMLRKLYELSCYENIPALFDFMPSSSVVFIYFSITRDIAELSGFGQFRSLVDNIPYFNDNFSRNKNLNSILRFPEDVLMLHGSKAEHSISMNLIGSILDEANFFSDGTSRTSANVNYSEVANLYTSVVNRRRTRFMDKGVDPGLSILVSSAKHSTSFTQQRIEEKINDPRTKVIHSKLWDVKPDKYSDKKFYVFKGSELLDPFIVEDVPDVNQYLESNDKQIFNPEYFGVEEVFQQLSPVDKQFFEPIPIDFKDSFEMNIIKALQDIAGVSASPVGKLFTSRSSYREACKEELSHPFTKDAIILATGTETKLSDYLRSSYSFKNKSVPRYIHIDQSITTDSTGIAMAHVDRIETVDNVSKPIVRVDLMLRINPPRPPKQISIGKVRDFVFYLVNVEGLNIKQVSYDMYASSESRQVLEEHDIPADTLSVDKDDSVYLTLVNLFYEQRVEIYGYKPFRLELFDLVHNRSRRKIDHPPESSKDVSDSVAGAVFNAVNGDISPVSRGEEPASSFLDANVSENIREVMWTLDDLLR